MTPQHRTPPYTATCAADAPRVTHEHTTAEPWRTVDYGPTPLRDSNGNTVGTAGFGR